MPPLRAVRAFEVVARHESIKLAAQELNLTAGAVGQQIKLLEQWLEVELFHRHAKMITITKQGREYYSRIAPALAQIASASQELRQGNKSTVSVSLVPSLAARWLVERLEYFIADHPDIDIVLEASTRLADFQRESIDMAIRYFDGNDDSLEKVLLCGGQGLALCTPAYRDRLHLKEPDDIRKATLLQAVLHADWDDWLGRHTTFSTAVREQIREIRCNQITLAIDTARQSMGVVLASPLLVQKELGDGTLVEPFENRIELSKRFYLVHRQGANLTRPARLFRDWLIEQFRNVEIQRLDG